MKGRSYHSSETWESFQWLTRPSMSSPSYVPPQLSISTFLPVRPLFAYSRLKASSHPVSSPRLSLASTYDLFDSHMPLVSKVSMTTYLNCILSIDTHFSPFLCSLSPMQLLASCIQFIWLSCLVSLVFFPYVLTQCRQGFCFVPCCVSAPRREPGTHSSAQEIFVEWMNAFYALLLNQTGKSKC